VNGKTLDVEVTADDIALYVHSGGKLLLNDDEGGELNVTGGYGVKADGAGSSATVTNATGISEGDDQKGFGAVAYGGSAITVRGSTTGNYIGAYAVDEDSMVEVAGDANGTGGRGIGASVEFNGSITVGGDVTGGECGAYAYGGSSITIAGNAESGYMGVGAGGNAVVELRGNVLAALGAFADSGGNVIIDGIIDPSASMYIQVTHLLKTKDQNDAISSKDGYLQYSASGSTVWVKIP